MLILPILPGITYRVGDDVADQAGESRPSSGPAELPGEIRRSRDEGKSHPAAESLITLGGEKSGCVCTVHGDKLGSIFRSFLPGRERRQYSLFCAGRR